VTSECMGLVLLAVMLTSCLSVLAEIHGGEQ
jgi:hypothetical protein